MDNGDPNERFRSRRAQARRRRRLRRSAAAAVLLLAAAAVALGARSLDGEADPEQAASRTGKPGKPASARPRPLPYEIRGVHVTVALASIAGKIEEYAAMPGLNTIELDVKDENGQIGFVSPAVPLARQIGAARPYYKPRRVAVELHEQGIYLIGRLVVFEDPVLAEKRPALAIRTRDGGVWRNDAGLGWANPYDKRVWDYNLDVAKAAVRAGFDEIQFDYVRFPSDGDVSAAVFPGKRAEPKGWTIARFVHYASKRLRPLGVRVSVDVFGLSATRDLGIGQAPRRLAKYVDAVYPMVYPSHYRSGEYGLSSPSAVPGVTVARSLRDFRRALRGTKARLVPWLEDFSLGRTRTFAEVREQIRSARRATRAGFLLWNPSGVYTEGTLTSP